MIPLLPNIGYAEITSAGTINDVMGSAKSQLPIQFFRLTENISGNLTLANDSAHKKIILDTNGKTITNSSGSPLTNNSSITLEIKGSGNIQSTLKTFTSSVNSASNTGTTTISDADSSTVVVSSVDRTADISLAGGVSVAQGFGGSYTTSNTVYLPNTELITTSVANPGSNSGRPSAAANAAGAELLAILGGASMPNIQSGVSGLSITVTTSGTSVTHTAPTSTSGSGSTFQTFFGTVKFSRANSARMEQAVSGPTPSVSAMRIPNNVVEGASRTIAFTNNLTVPVVLTGTDPYNNVTVAAGATNTITRTSTDGSFNLTGTVSGNDGSSQPFALSPVNSGTGSISSTAYTGTFSASAL